MVDATDSNPVFCQFESDIRYARVAQRKRHSIKDADSVGSNPTSGINVYVFQLAEKLYSECSNVQVRILSYTAPIAQ